MHHFKSDLPCRCTGPAFLCKRAVTARWKPSISLHRASICVQARGSRPLEICNVAAQDQYFCGDSGESGEYVEYGKCGESNEAGEYGEYGEWSEYGKYCEYGESGEYGEAGECECGEIC